MEAAAALAAVTVAVFVFTYHHHANPLKVPGGQHILEDMAIGAHRTRDLLDQNRIRKMDILKHVGDTKAEIILYRPQEHVCIHVCRCVRCACGTNAGFRGAQNTKSCGPY